VFTQKQISALKHLISVARDVPVLTKKILWFLIEASEMITKEVAVTLWENRDGFTVEEINEVFMGMKSMRSCNWVVHLDEIMYLLGTDFEFEYHYGHLDPKADAGFNSDGQFKNVNHEHPTRFTFWLARGYSRDAITLPITKTDLEVIDLSRPGLYPDLEASRSRHT